VGFQCATLTVPLDDAKPGLGTVALALTRHKATGRNRIGSLVVNPGGPGASAVDFLQRDYPFGFPVAIRAHFDLVAFDPRGVGHSLPVRCLSGPALDAYFHLDPVADDPAELSAIDAANRKLAQGCLARSRRVLPYVSTMIAAQDLDRVRLAVGDVKLTYLGYSYGTQIGTSYLEQFPTHVRAMVLDGALDPTLTWDQLLAGNARGFDVALGAFLRDCQRTRCAFRKAVSGDLSTAFDALAAKLDAHPIPGDRARTVGRDEFLNGVARGLYRRDSWPAIAGALSELVHDRGGSMLELNDEQLERGPNGTYSNLFEAYEAVTCIDQPWPRTDQPYQALARQVQRQYPHFGAAVVLSGMQCAFWPIGPVSIPHRVVAAASPPVVVIGTTRDPATPYSWAQGLARQLAHAILLTHVGDGHTAYRLGAPACITGPVDDYLISLRAPASATC
jgi:pimeloyl-ACP methyl ester carboxylesterase